MGIGDKLLKISSKNPQIISNKIYCTPYYIYLNNFNSKSINGDKIFDSNINTKNIEIFLDSLDECENISETNKLIASEYIRVITKPYP